MDGVRSFLNSLQGELSQIFNVPSDVDTSTVGYELLPIEGRISRYNDITKESNDGRYVNHLYFAIQGLYNEAALNGDTLFRVEKMADKLIRLGDSGININPDVYAIKGHCVELNVVEGERNFREALFCYNRSIQKGSAMGRLRKAALLITLAKNKPEERALLMRKKALELCNAVDEMQYQHLRQGKKMIERALEF